MKLRDLERRLRELGWTFDREGGRHRVYVKPGHRPMPVPRHAEVNEQTARAILRKAAEEGDT